MAIHKVVVHELKKEQHKDIQDSNFRDTVLDPANPAVIKLLDGVTEIYGTRHNSAHYGTFVNGEGRGAFPDNFEIYKAFEDPTDEQFMALSLVGMRRLYEKASGSKAATGGYILFADYENPQGRYFLTAMIKKTPGLTLTARLEPEELEQLDLRRLHQAARISFSRLSDYEAAEPDAKAELNYLSFISSTNTKSASGYFVTALGCAPGAAAVRATDNLLSESKRFFRENEDLKPKREEFVNALYEYLDGKEKDGESVKLSEVGHVVTRHIPDSVADRADEIVETYMARMNSEEVAIPVEFPVSRTALNKHTRITAKGNGWKFSFEKGALGEDEAADIYYNRAEESLTLTRLPPDMVDKILETLDEYDQDDPEE